MPDCGLRLLIDTLCVTEDWLLLLGLYMVPPKEDGRWLWVYYNKIPIYPIFYLLQGCSQAFDHAWLLGSLRHELLCGTECNIGTRTQARFLRLPGPNTSKRVGAAVRRFSCRDVEGAKVTPETLTLNPCIKPEYYMQAF